MTSPLPMPFIVGAPRSGTTLLRMILDAHPDVVIPPETGFIPELKLRNPSENWSWEIFLDLVTNFETWSDFHLCRDTLAKELRQLQPFTLPDGLRCFYRTYAQRFSKPRWGDKTPNNGLHLRAIGALLPEARFIHIIRDGRDVAASIRNLWFAPSRDFGKLGEDWAWRVQTIRAQGQEYPFYMEVRYEELLLAMETVIKTICTFLDLPFSARMLEYYQFSPARLQEHESRSRPDGTMLISKEARHAMQFWVTQPPNLLRCGVWKTVMSEDEHAQFLQTARSLLQELHYL